jgi:succinate dehydrogenase / fumarate reductase, flavoprotein subunit
MLEAKIPSGPIVRQLETGRSEMTLLNLDARIPLGPIEQKWDRCRFEMKLVNPANRRKHSIIVVGAGLAGAAAAATLGQQGYHVHCFSYHDTPRRAHSIAAQGGINAAKNYRNDGDSILRLFKDTINGGDFRAREANVYRLVQISLNIIDQCVAQGVPFAREYGGLLDTRSFGGVQVQRTFYARGQTGQQLLLGAHQALQEQIAAGTVTMHIRRELLDVVIVDSRARGIVTRDLVTGEIECHAADVVVLATGGYSNVFYLSTNAKASNCTAIWRAHRRGALFGNPCFTQIHPTCIPLSSEHQSKLTLMSESLRNDGRVWVPKKKGETRAPKDIPEDERDYYLENRYPSFGNLVPRDVASRNVKEVCDEGRGIGPHGQGVYLDFADAIQRLGLETVRDKYGNLFGGEANFSDHGANRLGASALMQGLADGYFVLPCTVPDYIASTALDPIEVSHLAFAENKAEVKNRFKALTAVKGKRSPDSFHRELGKIMWDNCGMARSDAGLRKALARIPELREEFWHNLKIVGADEELNQALEKANRVSDFLEIAELMCMDALDRAESCGGHFRVESQTDEGEAKRDDANFSYTAAWEWKGPGKAPALHKEPLTFEYVPLSQRSYK